MIAVRWNLHFLNLSHFSVSWVDEVRTMAFRLCIPSGKSFFSCVSLVLSLDIISDVFSWHDHNSEMLDADRSSPRAASKNVFLYETRGSPQKDMILVPSIRFKIESD